MLCIEGGNASLRHQTQQQGVNLGPRAIDFVEEEDRKIRAVLQNRSWLDARPAVLGNVGVIDHVGGHQVDRALDALKISADRARSRSQQRCFSNADITFKKNVATRENGYRDEPHRAGLTYDDLADAVLKATCDFRRGYPLQF